MNAAALLLLTPAAGANGPLTDENIRKVIALFGTEADYKKNMNALWNTRRGLNTMLDQRPDLKPALLPQFHILNNMIDALLPEVGPYPPFKL